MGIPYSKQINAAFDQVTPLVAAGFEVLETTKNISILLAAIQVLTVVFLALILLVLLGIAFTLNPDLDRERRQLVTPTLKWIAGWAHLFSSLLSSTLVRILIAGVMSIAAASLGWSVILAIQRGGRLEIDDAGQAEEERADEKRSDAVEG